jgi:ubiquinone/menaquinone biosynthesis C-methylase UbiE
MIEREGHRVFNPAYRFYLDWPKRDSWQQPERVLSVLSISEGLVVADIGAGTGYFTKRLAERVGSGGLVYATDVQEKMIDELRSLVEERELENVVVVHAGFDDPQLPANCCDLVLFVNVYKEIDDRVLYMQRVKQALKPNGRVAILGFRPDAPGPGPPRDARLSAQQVSRELSEAGFAPYESHDFLPRQYFLVVVIADRST